VPRPPRGIKKEEKVEIKCFDGRLYRGFNRTKEEYPAPHTSLAGIYPALTSSSYFGKSSIPSVLIPPKPVHVRQRTKGMRETGTTLGTKEKRAEEKRVEKRYMAVLTDVPAQTTWLSWTSTLHSSGRRSRSHVLTQLLIIYYVWYRCWTGRRKVSAILEPKAGRQGREGRKSDASSHKEEK